MTPKLRATIFLLAILGVFSAGYAAGVNRFGMPKTVLHVVIIQWKPTTTAAQRQAVIDGVREMAARIPGIRNIWVKPVRVASMKWNYAFAIEFANRAAVSRYASDPTHAAWSKLEQAARLDSLNVQIGNRTAERQALATSPAVSSQPIPFCVPEAREESAEHSLPFSWASRKNGWLRDREP